MEYLHLIFGKLANYDGNASRQVAHIVALEYTPYTRKRTFMDDYKHRRRVKKDFTWAHIVHI